MDPNIQKKQDRLARVRENQRRSRARRQEHICFLEQKLASLQEQAHRQDVEHRIAVQRLEAENRGLRLLLSRVGVPANTIAEYVQATGDPNMNQKIAIPALREPQTNFEPRDRRRKCPGLPLLSGSQTGPQTESSGRSLDTSVSQKSTSLKKTAQPQETQDRQTSTQRQSMCGCLSDEAPQTWPASYDILNTTLCAIAEELVKQYNTRGVDMAEIQKRLWAGFCNGVSTDEGCRVQNQILFQVLDEISDN